VIRQLNIKLRSMNRVILISLMLMSFPLYLKAQSRIPEVVSGKIERIGHFESKYVSSRTIDIWLPEGYSDSSKSLVLYMHDGQMLFDPKHSWNRQAWDIDDVASQLLRFNKIKSLIVVGIWHSGSMRHSDYFPQEPFEQLSQMEEDTVTAQLERAGRTKGSFQPQSDSYLKFIVEELKPYIDKKYSVHTNRENTYIAGSSMGGLISLYAVCEYPEIFGGAACLSTHWPGTFTLDNNPVPNSFINYLSRNLPNPKGHRIYFDCGDQTLDTLYPSIQRRVDSLMTAKGYDESSWVTKYCPGDDHSEKSWNKRLNVPLEFLLKRSSSY